MRFFGSNDATGNRRGIEPRVPRSSSGWGHVQKTLLARDGLRVLDVGPTSANNINYITSLGHSIYMTNLVEEAAKTDWLLPATENEPSRFDVEQFMESNLAFNGRTFDVVLLWDTADYIPPALLQPVMQRIEQVLAPQGQLLAFFHTKLEEADEGFTRYHLTTDAVVEMQRAGSYAVTSTYNNRQIEKLLSGFSSYRFFLAKDNLREVIATR